MSKQQLFDKVDILGVSVDVVTLAEAITYICDSAKDRSKPASYVIKPYVEFLDGAATRADLRELLAGAELSVADGVAILWAAHYLYAGPRTLLRFWLTLSQIVLAPTKLTWPVPERAAGTTFTWPLLVAASTAGLRVYLIGKTSQPEIDGVAEIITKRLPGIAIAGTMPGHDPGSKPGSVSEGWLNDTVTRLITTQADLVLVGMGFPLQETVCAKLVKSLGHGVLIGEGGTFDYDSFGGPRRKAPVQVQRLGIEWLWRLVLEPSRWRRQLAIPRFIFRIWRSR